MIALILAAALTQTPPQQTQQTLTPLHKSAVCQVRTEDRDGSRSIGSGVLIVPPPSHAGQVLVLTAAHVVQDARITTVTWDGVHTFQAYTAAARPAEDIAILRLVAPDPDQLPVPRPLATTDAVLGETCWVAGFGPLYTLNATVGPVTTLAANEKNDPVWFKILAGVRQGDSGGPVFVMRGGDAVVAGVAWGGDRASSHAARISAVMRAFGARTTQPITTQPITTQPPPAAQFILAAPS